jgi:Oxidoreductase molybdopterin binding domain
VIRKRLSCLTAFVIPALALILCAARPVLIAQQMQHSAPSVPSTQLTIRTYEGKTLTLSPNELAALPHKSVVVFNAHNKANETYSGVPLADLLSTAGVPLGESVRGKLFMTGIVAEGTDNYGVLYSLAEVDPSIHTGDVIVADMLDGKRLEKDGAFKMVSSEERRPARWVRNLTAISVVKVEP